MAARRAPHFGRSWSRRAPAGSILFCDWNVIVQQGSNNAGARIGRRIMLGLVALSSAETRTGAHN